MPRKPRYVVIVYQDSSPTAIVGYGRFWRMVWQAAVLVCRCRWDTVTPGRTCPPELYPLFDAMKSTASTMVMH